jgi:hypothetical protein
VGFFVDISWPKPDLAIKKREQIYPLIVFEPTWIKMNA